MINYYKCIYRLYLLHMYACENIKIGEKEETEKEEADLLKMYPTYH